MRGGRFGMPLVEEGRGAAAKGLTFEQSTLITNLVLALATVYSHLELGGKSG